MVEHTTKTPPATPVAPTLQEEELPPIVYVTEVLSVHDDVTVETLPEVSTNGSWVCNQCTLINHSSYQYCEACGYWINNNNESPPTQQQDESKLVCYEHRREENESIQLEASREQVVDLGESPFERKMRRRRRRKGRMAAGAAGGAIVGGVLLCGVGAIVGALAGGAIARNASKRGEQRKDRRVEAITNNQLLK